jgi:TolC family type I secretion outer membrane protein
MCVAQAGTAAADTLADALAKAYLTNPTLNSARASVRAADERVPQAISGWRPTVSLRGEVQTESSVSNQFTSSNPSGQYRGDRTESGTLAIILEQPLFRGFRTIESTRSAEAQVKAARQGLLQTEQQVLFDAVQAYMSVFAGRQLVALRRQDVAALEAHVKASKSRLAYGEITQTDLAQSEARLAESRNALIDQRVRLAQDVAFYVQVVGQEPAKLFYPKVPQLPVSLDMAMDMAGALNPRILAQAFVEEATSRAVNVARSGLLPSANLRARALVSDGDIGKDDTGFQAASITAEMSVPIYEAGLVYSQVREAKQRASQSRIELIEVSRDVLKVVSQSWNSYVGLGEVIRNTKIQVAAAQTALDGVQQEYKAGMRSTLDVLDAQRELVQSQALRVNAEKARVVAAFQLLAAVGHLTAENVGLDVPLYDAEENYRLVRNKVIGTGIPATN